MIAIAKQPTTEGCPFCSGTIAFTVEISSVPPEDATCYSQPPPDGSQEHPHIPTVISDDPEAPSDETQRH